MSRILIVDDDGETCRFMAELLERPDREIRTTQHVSEALTQARQPFDLLISDINLDAQQNGMDVLRAFKQANTRGHVVLISGFGTLQTAIDAVRAGAFDYISKPFNISEVKATVERALSDVGTPVAPRPSLDVPPPGLIGRTAGMLSVYKQIAHAANAGAPVRPDQLRRADRKRAGVGTVRAYPRVVHRRDRRHQGHLRTGHRRHGVP